MLLVMLTRVAHPAAADLLLSLDRDYNRKQVDTLLAEHKEIVIDVAGPPFCTYGSLL